MGVEERGTLGDIGVTGARADEPLLVQTEELVDGPAHYGGKENPYEAIKVIENWELGFHLGNTVKYISRAGKKGGPATEVLDLEKALWYLQRRIDNLRLAGATEPQ